MIHLNFDNKVLQTLPLDSNKQNYTRQVKGAFFSLCMPTPLQNPKLITYSKDALKLIGINYEGEMTDQMKEELANYFSGNVILEGSQPASHCYCGYQFGFFAGQLGDGRAHYLGEVINESGERWELQLKGSGKTPYSRQGDGRAVLRSSVREFLCSEAMYYLGIPTTRAGTLVTSSSEVVRDLKYDGNPILEKCTVVLRIAPSFLRFGSFEVFLDKYGNDRKGPSVGLEDPNLNYILNYTIQYHYPMIWNDENLDEKGKYLAFYKEVVRRSAILVAEWQCVGFTHGVLNTDNMSILGLTIDYGPFGFLDDYEPDFISNGSDHDGRYSYINQPYIFQWNCKKLAEALEPVLPLEETEEISNSFFNEVYQNHFLSKMRKKLGLIQEFENDKKLVEELLNLMKETYGDFTNIFRSLSKLNISFDNEEEMLQIIMNNLLPLNARRKKIKPIFTDDQFSQLQRYIEMNPFLLQRLIGISSEKLMKEMDKRKALETLKNVDETESKQKYLSQWTDWLNKYKERIVLDIAASTVTAEEYSQHRKQLMNSNNPKYILRNYIAQQAIQKAERGDYSEIEKIFKILKNPYDEQPEYEVYSQLPPDWSYEICVTCSS